MDTSRPVAPWRAVPRPDVCGNYASAVTDHLVCFQSLTWAISPSIAISMAHNSTGAELPQPSSIVFRWPARKALVLTAGAVDTGHISRSSRSIASD